MATAPLYAPNPFYAVAQISTANTALNGGGTITDLKLASTNGAGFTRLDRIRIQAIGDTTAGAIRFFIKRGVGGTWMFLREIIVEARTLANGDAAWFTDIDCTETDELLYLQGSPVDKIGVATKKAETFNVFVWGGDT